MSIQQDKEFHPPRTVEHLNFDGYEVAGDKGKPMRAARLQHHLRLLRRARQPWSDDYHQNDGRRQDELGGRQRIRVTRRGLFHVRETILRTETSAQLKILYEDYPSYRAISQQHPRRSLAALQARRERKADRQKPTRKVLKSNRVHLR